MEETTPASTATAQEEKDAGNLFYKNKEYDNAIAAYTRAIELDDKSETAALCYSNRSAVFQVQKKFARAEKDAQLCLTIKPDFIKGYIRLAVAQRKQNKFDEAAKTVTAGLKLAPDDAELAKTLEAIEKAREKKTEVTVVAAKGSGGLSAERLMAVQRELTLLQETREGLLGRHAEVSMQAKHIYRGTQRTEMTLAQLEELPPDCGSYMAVGKAFLRKPMAETKAILTAKTAKAGAGLQQLQQKEAWLAEKLQANQNEIQALVRSVQVR